MKKPDLSTHYNSDLGSNRFFKEYGYFSYLFHRLVTKGFFSFAGPFFQLTCDPVATFLFCYTLREHGKNLQRYNDYWNAIQQKVYEEINTSEGYSTDLSKKEAWKKWIETEHYWHYDLPCFENLTKLASKIVDVFALLQPVEDRDLLKEVPLDRFFLEKKYPENRLPKKKTTYLSTEKQVRQEKNSPIAGLLHLWKVRYEDEEKQFQEETRRKSITSRDLKK